MSGQDTITRDVWRQDAKRLRNQKIVKDFLALLEAIEHTNDRGSNLKLRISVVACC